MKNKVFLIGILAILFSMTVVTAPAAAQEIEADWQRKEFSLEPMSPFYWEGTLLQTSDGIEFWELYFELDMMMMPMPGVADDVEPWVLMTVMWDNETKKGDVPFWKHVSPHLQFTGWTGFIEYNNENTNINADGAYHLKVSGKGIGKYKVDGVWRHLHIIGSFEADLIPYNPRVPLEYGETAGAIERATLIYLDQDAPVGGEVAPVSSLALLAPWIVIAIAAMTIGFAITRRKLFLH